MGKAPQQQNDVLNWESLASTKLGEIERPPMKPAGHYVGLITGRATQGESKKKGTLFLEFPVQINSALEDVDTDELEAAGGPQFKGSIIFWMSPNSMYRFKEFSIGQGASDDLSALEAAEYLASCGEPFVVEARHEPNEKNPEQVFLRLDNPIPMSVWQSRQSS